jgi:hypothetical protein
MNNKLACSLLPPSLLLLNSCAVQEKPLIAEIEHKDRRKVQPQQVDNITWQEVQPPQIIGVK